MEPPEDTVLPLNLTGKAGFIENIGSSFCCQVGLDNKTFDL